MRVAIKGDHVLRPRLPKVSVLSIFTNGSKFVEGFVSTVLETDYQNFEVIIIDNASSDKTEEKLARYKDSRLRVFRKVTKDPITKNLNDGISLSHGEYLVHADSDVMFPYTDWLSKLVEAMDDHPNAAGANPMILFHDGETVQSMGMFQSLLHPGWLLFLSGERATRLTGLPPLEVWGLHGAVALWKKKALLQTGGFDEGLFPIWVEDGDMSWRLRLMGYSFIAVPAAKVIHFMGGSTPSQGHKFIVKKNALRIILKNMSTSHLPIYLPAWLFSQLYFNLKNRDWEGFLQLLKAIVWNIEKIRSTLLARRKIRRKKRVSDASALRPTLPLSYLLRAFR